MEGIRFRGKTIPETFAALPKYPGSDYPSVEAFWCFILTGDVPTEAQANEVIEDFKKRAEVPELRLRHAARHAARHATR